MKKAKYKHFEHYETDENPIYDQAIEFIDQLGEDRLINVTNTHTESSNRYSMSEKVTVWYWEEISEE